MACGDLLGVHCVDPRSDDMSHSLGSTNVIAKKSVIELRHAGILQRMLDRLSLKDPVRFR
jgi:hypothetical protein